MLRLLEDFRLDDVRGAVQDAVRLGAIGFDAVKHLVRCRLDHRPPHLDLAQYPHLPVAPRGHDRGRELPGPPGGRVMTKPTLLLDAHLKALRLPTFLREYDKVARHCAQEGLDCPRYLFRLCELELLDREQRAVERRIKTAKFPVLKSLETFEFPAIPSVNKRLVLELARSEYLDRRENVLAFGELRHGQDASRARVGARGLSARLSGPLHHRRRAGERTPRGPGRQAPLALAKAARQAGSPDRRRARLRPVVKDQRRAAVRDLLPALRASVDARDLESPLQRMGPRSSGPNASPARCSTG